MTGLVERSLAVVREHQAGNGAFVACPTFPTYAYCWFRDGTYIAYALDQWGEHERARRFYDWALAAVVSRAAATERAITCGLRGDPLDPADLLHTRYGLDGAAGEDEWPNHQLDGFGTLLWGAAAHLDLSGRALPASWCPAINLVARYLGALWRSPCYDCWEEFGDRVHTATLAAIYGGLTAAARLSGDARHAEVAAEIADFVRTSCIDGNGLRKAVDDPRVDASLVHVATPYRLLTPADPVMSATIVRIERELRRDGGGVRRYVDDSYYGGGEWILLTAYLGWLHVERGELAAAEALRGWIERQADAEGLLPEQVAVGLNQPEMLPVWEERWGRNARPLLWSHAAYLTLVAALRRAAAGAVR